MWTRSKLVAFTLFLSVMVSLGSAQSVGEPLSPFSPGSLEIHHINTGEGTAAFLVLPDGTTLLIDCGFGQAARPPKYKAPRRPDESRLPGEWVARYIKRVHPGGADAPRYGRASAPTTSTMRTLTVRRYGCDMAASNTTPEGTARLAR